MFLVEIILKCHYAVSKCHYTDSRSRSFRGLERRAQMANFEATVTFYNAFSNHGMNVNEDCSFLSFTYKIDASISQSLLEKIARKFLLREENKIEREGDAA